ncbi:MAG: thioesterase family protein [Pseudomonadota bacterium]
MTNKTLSEIINAGEAGDSGVLYPVTENWKQGRTAYGGFTTSIMLNAAHRLGVDLPPLRSALVNFTAPVTAAPMVHTEITRQGRNITTIAARAEVDGKLAATATFAFGKAQESQISVQMSGPEANAPEDTHHYFPPELARPPVAFFENFDVRLIDGAIPFSGAERGYVRAWARHKDENMRNSMDGLIAIADVLPPAVFPMLRTPGPNSSVNWICNFLAERPQTRDGWWMLENQLSAGSNGYSSQLMRIWNTEGELVVDGMQSVVIFV